jgi:N-6 DNA Methylase
MGKYKIDPRILDHLEWLGFVKPVGLVVSAPALVRAGAILNRRDTDGQCALRELIEQKMLETKTGSEDVALDFEPFTREVLGWSFSPKGFAGTEDSPVPEDLSTQLSEGGPTLAPDFAVRELEPKEGSSPWQLLVQVLEPSTDFDKVIESKNHVELSPQGRMERLLRKTGVTAGLLFNGKALRLISAPRGESSGWVDFDIADMASTAGRSILAAMRMLLSQERLLSLPKAKRLPALLEDSRKFQNEVSERLAEQVLEGLYEFLRGFQAAHDASKGELLKEVLEGDPDVVYRALLTVILRMVFLLYAEERDMLPQDEIFLRNYSIAGLHERLREDAALNPDTMDQRFGAWAQLVVLFRMVYDGADYPGGQLPKRHGDLFDPERFPFLEGRKEKREPGQRFEVPLVPDGTIYRVLEKLLVLDGERLSYRALDVEQIGSVYETMMGFRVDTATGRSVAIRAEKKHGAPTTINLEELLAELGAKREKWLQDNAGRKLSDSVNKSVKEATSLDGLVAALEKVIDKRATPDVVPAGSLILQPSEARRKSGSHYTPRSLTEPIVRTTLEPIFLRLAKEATGDEKGTPKPEQILDLKVCDPAMGSGAFLVEACRQLAEALIEAWRVHGGRPEIPADEDEVIFARRLVAQRCLYGVDKNPMAVDLAKVSLWLATLARDHAFTFVDHALKCGDSLVGLNRVQVDHLSWDTSGQRSFTDRDLPAKIEAARKIRVAIAEREADHDALVAELDKANKILADLRLIADGVVTAYFLGADKRGRTVAQAQVADWVRGLIGKGEFRAELEMYGAKLRELSQPLTPFHWEFEFPEVFLRSNAGFDAIVGNPPFAGKNTIASANPEGYVLWLQEIHGGSHGNSDLVAHFFRSAFDLIRKNGTFGLIATNTIAQGDTRSTGLRWICNHSGVIFVARRRMRWPGLAAVIVSVVHVGKGAVDYFPQPRLDGSLVEHISAFLFHRGANDDPFPLAMNAGKSYQGPIPLGAGFTFDDGDASGKANSIAEMETLLKQDPRNTSVIFPYIGGEEINSSPIHMHDRYVINFEDRDELECREKWPLLLDLVYRRVKPERDKVNRSTRRDYWWRFGEGAPALFRSLLGKSRMLAHSFTSEYLQFAFIPANTILAGPHSAFPVESYAAFVSLQCRCHEIWVNFTSSTNPEGRLSYKISDSFNTYPFISDWDLNPTLEAVGESYYIYRADVMVRNNEGLTKTYNRFHDPEEHDPDILRLRELHAEMDRAVLDAYGWTDIPTDCEFILDYEDEEDEADAGSGKKGRQKKKPWRYRWPDDVRDEVLARLLELNKQRYEEEVRLVLHAKGKGKSKVKSKDGTSDGQSSLIELD